MNKVAAAPRTGDLPSVAQLNCLPIDLPYTIRVYGVTEEMFDELVDEDTRADLIDGVMIVHSPASRPHDRASALLRGLMDFYAEEKELGEVSGPDSFVRLATGRRFCPDGYFVREDRLPSPEAEQFEGAPDLVIETLSPSNRDVDLEEKRPAYREAGVKEIWFVDTQNRQVLIDRKRGKRYREQVATKGKVPSDVLEGFWINVDWLWAKPRPNKLACLREILGTS